MAGPCTVSPDRCHCHSKHYAAKRFIHWKYVCPGDRKPLWFRGDRRLFRCYQVKYFCYQFIYGSWKLSFQLYGPEPGSRKERTAAFGISYRYPFISNCFPSFIVLYFFASRQMMGLFLNDSSIDAINAGQKFLHIVSPMYFMISIKLMTDGIIRGAGAMHYFVMATVPDLILRILVALLLTQYFGSTGIWMAWPFGWIAATVLTIIFYRRIITGKYVIRL